MSINPYIFFSGNCAEAFTRYSEIFGAEATIMRMGDAPADARMPGAADDVVMHASIQVGDSHLMGSDDPSGDGGPKVGFSVSYTAPDADTAHRVFGELADGGTVTMPIQSTFWAPAFGMVTDRFGTPWMIDTHGETTS